MLDSSCLLNRLLLKSKVLILLAAACMVWLVILKLAFLVFTGSGVTAGWIFAGALVLAMSVWMAVIWLPFHARPARGKKDEGLFYLGYEP